ncbi:MAG TPA: hypothetical protein PKA28_04445 [Methylomusa anaerophila]|uniref:Dual OB-containing domain-containing protein n=1 Tax=Methylomusa anaerophila TaxID=1930071 RepID=A0A348AN23_9FIRM|nr:hypothetical protein [Methylomusa anaerophila]BBB92471.1 hypothetical protein MAMMFC1_03164 [Methylomusa anaerophila]HML87677.1 hypothetical protein [Methylomusa anaerophila]
MDKQIILLAKSKKMGHYCTAGIDIATGEWIRIVSEDASIQHAVCECHMRYESGAVPQVLDIINIGCQRHSPNEYQNENYVLNPSCTWEKIGQASIQDVLRIHPIDKHNALFYNYNHKVSHEVIQQTESSLRYSLALIDPDNVKILIEPKQYNDEKSIKVQFWYNGSWYKYIRVTDPEFLARYSSYDYGVYALSDDVLFVMSLGDAYSNENSHYKLVATVLEAY